jgi:ketosteroid isomerase-like protein
MEVANQDRLDIEAMLIEMVARRDRGERERIAELFTDDGVLVAPYGARLEGRAVLLAHFTRPAPPEQNMHFLTNRTFAALPNDRVEVRTYTITLEDKPGGVVVIAGNTRDVVVKKDGAWRVEIREVNHLLRGRLTPVEA